MSFTDLVKHSSFENLVVLLVGDGIGLSLCIAGGEAVVHERWRPAFIGFGVGLPLMAIASSFPFWKHRAEGLRNGVVNLAMFGIPVAILLAIVYVLGPHLFIFPLVSTADEIAAAVVRGLPKASALNAPSSVSVQPAVRRKNPIDDDAIKWKIVRNLHYGITNPKSTLYQNAKGRKCEVVVVRYSTSTYGEKYFASLREIFDTIGWSYHEEFAKSTLPKALSIRWMEPGRTNLGPTCGSTFLSRINGDIPGLNTSFIGIYGRDNDDQYLKACSGECFEIDIGNEPEQ